MVCESYSVASESTKVLTTCSLASVSAPQLICLSLLWLLIGWFWSIILIGCCEHPSFIPNTKWKTAVRNLVSMAWHGMTYMMAFGYDIEISTILESLDLFFTVEVLYYGQQYCPNFSSSKVSSLNVIHGCDFTVPGCDVQSYLIQLYENLRLVRRIAYCKPGILTDWDPYPSPPFRSFGSPLFQIHPSLVLGNHLKRTRKKRGKWRGKVKESDGDR